MTLQVLTELLPPRADRLEPSTARHCPCETQVLTGGHGVAVSLTIDSTTGCYGVCGYAMPAIPQIPDKPWRNPGGQRSFSNRMRDHLRVAQFSPGNMAVTQSQTASGLHG